MPGNQQSLYIRDMIWGGVWGAAALFLPILLHPFGLGVHLMPMFLPLLIAGCTLHLRTSLTLAVAVPLISSLFTGMPPLYPPIALLIVLEAVSMCFWVYLAYRRRRWNIYLVLIIAFLVQRVVRAIFILIFQKVLQLPEFWLLVPALLWGLPGVVLQVVVIPRVIGVIEERLPVPIFGNNEVKTGRRVRT